MIGTTRTSPTNPSASAFRSGGTSSETCHRMAAFCMNEPVNERSRPTHSSRKSRCLRATNERLEITCL